jgi:PhnB protein
MPKTSLSSQLDAMIQAMLARRDEPEGYATEESAEAALFYGTSVAKSAAASGGSAPPDLPEKVAQLLPVATSLRGLTREEFRTKLKTQLEGRALMGSTARPAPEQRKTKRVPEGYHTVTPYLAVRGASEAIEFYKKAFGATEVSRLSMPDGKIGHAEIQVGDSRIMLSDEFPEYGALSPQTLGGTPTDIHLYVEDVDAWANRAIAAGAKVLVPVADQDYGERHGRLEDPFGHRWGISTPLKEDRAKVVRESFHTAAPYLVVPDGAKAIEFYREALGAVEWLRLTEPDGRVAHAEITIGDSRIMLGGEAPEYGRRSPQSIGGTPVKIHLFVEDVDALAAQSIAAGATLLIPVQDQFYGDRSGRIEDPFGHVWIISSHIEDVSPQEIERRAAAFMAGQSSAGTDLAPTKVKPAPEGYHTVTPYLAVSGAAGAIEFYKRAFGATEVSRLSMPDGKIGHAEVQVGDSRIMLSDEFPEYGALSPQSLGGTPTSIHLYVEDVDSLLAQAAAAGATITSPATDYEYGERQANLKDPFGHSWTLATFKEHVSAEEFQQREALKAQPGAGGQGETSKHAAKSRQYVRPGFSSAVPYLTVSDGFKAIEFYKRAFGGSEIESMRFGDPEGRLSHGEVTIGDSGIMLSGESEEYGKRGPRSLGGSPVKIHLFVEDVDALAAQAIAAGAKVLRPVQDQFYGDRSGQIEDPFGHIWIISSRIEDVSVPEIERRAAAFMAGQTSEASQRTQPAAAGGSAPGVREGYTAITPYLTVRRAAELVDFVKQAFGAVEIYRGTGSAGGLHAEVRIGNSMVMIGGGPGIPLEEKPAALVYYVEDTDAVYQRALQAGATSIQAPTDHDYGERGASVKDAFGNNWYIATSKGTRYVREGFHSLTPYLHPRSAAKTIDFLKQAFDAEEIARYADPSGRVMHAEVRIGDSMLEMGEAHGPYQPVPTGIYLYVADADATYAKALAAGATSVQLPADQPYGDRNAFVTDPFGTTWYIATYLKGSAG